MYIEKMYLVTYNIIRMADKNMLLEMYNYIKQIMETL